MQFTKEELEWIASWTPITPGFGREDTTIAAFIRPIIDHLTNVDQFAVRITQDGGMANYYSFLVHDGILGREYSGEIKTSACVVVQLSLMAPVGVYGLSTFSQGMQSFGYSNLDIDNVCNPDSPPNIISSVVVDAVRKTSPFQLLTKDSINYTLPAGIKIYDYCMCAEPWDRVYHALFSDTD